MAMLYLAHEAGLMVRVATVDHGLRPEAAGEAAEVGRVCDRLGVRHEVLRWLWDGKGNLQDAARRGRRAVLADWALRHGLGVVALAHTQDDVAETFLMRLARGAGVDGLSAMAARWDEGGVGWIRPLLAASRAELRDYLRGKGAAWVDDPSNDNDRFDRVKARHALAALAPLGLTTERLALVAAHLAEARAALEAATDLAAPACLMITGNAVQVDLAGQVAEVQRRLLGRVIHRVAPRFYAPRGPAVQALLARVLAGKPVMLAGCRFVWAKRRLFAFPEAWDGRWQIEGPVPQGAEMRALGAGIAQCPNWRATGLPRAALLVSPALWLGDTLIAAPHAGFGMAYSAKPLFPATALHHSVITH